MTEGTFRYLTKKNGLSKQSPIELQLWLLSCMAELLAMCIQGLPMLSFAALVSFWHVLYKTIWDLNTPMCLSFHSIPWFQRWNRYSYCFFNFTVMYQTLEISWWFIPTYPPCHISIIPSSHHTFKYESTSSTALGKTLQEQPPLMVPSRQHPPFFQ